MPNLLRKYVVIKHHINGPLTDRSQTLEYLLVVNTVILDTQDRDYGEDLRETTVGSNIITFDETADVRLCDWAAG